MSRLKTRRVKINKFIIYHGQLLYPVSAARVYYVMSVYCKNNDYYDVASRTEQIITNETTRCNRRRTRALVAGILRTVVKRTRKQ